MVRLLVAAVMAASAALAGCEPREQAVRVAAQDFRFAPSTIRIPAGVPVRLTLVNEGREPHELTGPLLTDPRVRVLAEAGSLRVLPGRSITVVLQTPPGTYTFQCRVRGHAGMEGTLIVEDREASLVSRRS